MISKKRVLAVLLLVSAVGSLLGSVVADPLRGLARMAIEPAGDGGMYLATAVQKRLSDAGESYISQDDAQTLAEENDSLRRQLEKVTRELLTAQRHTQTIQGIQSRLYGPTRETPNELIPARVVGGDSLPYSDTMIINAGAGQGAGVGQFVTTRVVITDRNRALPARLAVITASHLVGRLTETDAFSSRVQLITDREFQVPVQIRRIADRRRITALSDGRPAEENLRPAHPDIEAVAQGDGARGMVIPRVKALHKIRPGDVVLTRASDGYIGTEVPVGRVVQVDDDPKKPGLFVTLRVQPFADLDSLRDVYVIVPPRLVDSAGRQERINP